MGNKFLQKNCFHRTSSQNLKQHHSDCNALDQGHNLKQAHSIFGSTTMIILIHKAPMVSFTTTAHLRMDGRAYSSHKSSCPIHSTLLLLLIRKYYHTLPPFLYKLCFLSTKASIKTLKVTVTDVLYANPYYITDR